MIRVWITQSPGENLFLILSKQVWDYLILRQPQTPFSATKLPYMHLMKIPESSTLNSWSAIKTCLANFQSLLSLKTTTILNCYLCKVIWTQKILIVLAYCLSHKNLIFQKRSTILIIFSSGSQERWISRVPSIITGMPYSVVFIKKETISILPTIPASSSTWQESKFTFYLYLNWLIGIKQWGIA